ncbi:hypothetical protein [Caulobacter sp. BP25]|uniref:hypothetical protein n=1 Tax=Caulobacter sp. BP25 TaxID=2048900 RepID=UPI000C12C020|nr:hypothetical protein [Caulobacter sp. BP25]PHY18395.1 hypothetical protein CSW59_16770 [Caulobacter sp. BP25]
MDWGLTILGGLAAVMALQSTPDADPSPDDPAACEEASRSKDERGKRNCVRDPNTVDSLLVEGARRGDTDGPIEPELELNEADISALGVSTLGELMTKMAPLLNAARARTDGPPIFLVNGMRTKANIAEMPTEAIQRFAPLREEEALRHGERPDQLVINVILKKRFQSIALTNEGRWLTEGGRASTDQLASLFHVQGEGFTLASARYHRDSPLFEDERDVVRTPQAGGPEAVADTVIGGDLTASRTIMPRGEQAKIEVAHNRPLREGVSATVGGDLQINSTVSYRGLPGVALSGPDGLDVYRYVDTPGAFRALNDTRRIGAVAGVTARKQGWTWTLDGDADRSETQSRTGRGLDTSALRAAVAAGQVDPTGLIPADLIRYAPRDTADSVTTSAKLNLTASGAIGRLPAGPLRLTVRAGADHRRFEAESVRSGVSLERTLVRDRATVRTSLDAPLIDKDGPLSFLGKASLNLNGQYEDFSDIGGLGMLGGGLNWTPVKGLNLSADYSWEEGEPTLQQVNDPTQVTPNTLAYDYATGQTTFVTLTSGGNPNLRPDSRRLLKLSVNYKPFETHELRLQTNYTVTRIDDPIANFPAASPELEAAFPSRYTRDAQGRLTAIDTRPINFDHADTADLRTKITYRRSWGGPKRGSGPNLVFLTLTDRWRLRDEVTIRPGMAALDKLSGAALGQFSGSPRHEINASANLNVPGYSVGLGAFWRSPSRVDGGATGQDLRFSSPPSVNLFGVVDLGANKRLAKERPWLKGTRLTMNLENLFDTGMKVRDSQGRTPEAYQADLMKGGGRALRLGLRKAF